MQEILREAESSCVVCQMPVMPMDVLKNQYLEGLLAGWQVMKHAKVEYENKQSRLKRKVKHDENTRPTKQRVNHGVHLANVALQVGKEKETGVFPTISVSGLNANDLDYIRSGVRGIGGALKLEIKQNLTTHLVCKANAENRAKRTVKYMLCVLYGCWIVDYKWVRDSLIAGIWLPEEAYTISGDPIGIGAPEYFRNPNTPKLFANLTFGTYGPFLATGIAISDVAAIIKAAGGEYIGKKCVEQADTVSIVISNQRLRHTKQFQCPVLKPAWLFDCITLQKLLPTEKYQILNP